MEYRAQLFLSPEALQDPTHLLGSCSPCTTVLHSFSMFQQKGNFSVLKHAVLPLPGILSPSLLLLSVLLTHFFFLVNSFSFFRSQFKCHLVGGKKKFLITLLRLGQIYLEQLHNLQLYTYLHNVTICFPH